MGLEAPEDLSPEAVSAALPGREVQVFPALVSTEAAALAWARADGPQGGVVVANYQASPRGRGGLPLEVRPGEGLGFSLVLRPRLPSEREGWLYPVAASGLADVIGDDAAIEWPGEVHHGEEGGRACTLAVYVELGPTGTRWAVVTVVVTEASSPRAALLAKFVTAIEQRYASPPSAVLDDYLPRCRTIGRSVCARLIPMGPSGPQITGQAVDCLADGALVIETEKGNRVAVRPQHLGMLEDAG